MQSLPDTKPLPFITPAGLFLPHAHLPTVFSEPARAAGTGRPPSWHRTSGPWGKGLPTFSSCGVRWPFKYHPPCTSVSSSFTPCCVVLETCCDRGPVPGGNYSSSSFWCLGEPHLSQLTSAPPPPRVTLRPCRSCAGLGGRPLPTELYCWSCNFEHQLGCGGRPVWSPEPCGGSRPTQWEVTLFFPWHTQVAEHLLSQHWVTVGPCMAWSERHSACPSRGESAGCHRDSSGRHWTSGTRAEEVRGTQGLLGHSSSLGLRTAGLRWTQPQCQMQAASCFWARGPCTLLSPSRQVTTTLGSCPSHGPGRATRVALSTQCHRRPG